MFVSIFVYADDVIRMAPSDDSLQALFTLVEILLDDDGMRVKYIRITMCSLWS